MVLYNFSVKILKLYNFPADSNPTHSCSMLDRAQVRDQTKRVTTGVVYAVLGWSRFISGMHLLIRWCNCRWRQHLFKKGKAGVNIQGGVPTVCQGCGNHSNKITWTWHQKPLKKQRGFLIIRSLTLSSAPRWSGRQRQKVSFDKFHGRPKKINCSFST